MQTKAFEARESQWNRKLSIKHSLEKQVNQKKSDLSKEIVKAFEEARNYHLQPQQVTQSNQITIEQRMLQQSIEIQIPMLDLSKNFGKGTEERQELQNKDTQKQFDIIEKVLNSD